MSERPILAMDDQGEQVARLHRQLIALGYSVDAAESAMSLYGAATRRLVVSLQRQRGLALTGVVDAETALVLEGGAVTELAAPSSSESSGGVEPLTDADGGAEPAASVTGGDVAGPGHFGGSTPEALLETLPPELALSHTQREALAGTIAEDAGPGPSWRGSVAGLSPLQEGAVRSTYALARVIDGDLGLMRILQRRLPAEPDGTLAYLATMKANDWIAVAAEARPDASMSDIEQMAGSLGEVIEVQYPSLTFKTKLDAGVVDIPGFPSAKVADFLGAHGDFDLKATDVEPFLIDHGLGDDLEVKGAVLGVQRVLTLGATQAEAVEVLRAGLANAQGVFSAGLDRLNVLLGDRMDPARIATLYGNAYQVVTATLGVASMLAPALTGPALPALASPGGSATLLTRFPSLGAIFGDLSARTCEHCASVLGPAAYLVDLLNTVHQTHDAERELLRTRRPDIAQLELTCENTNRELPYTDLVLEILENAVTFPIGPITLTADQQAQFENGVVPESVSNLLAATVSSLTGPVTMLSLGGSESLNDLELAFVQGHRRWAAARSRKRLSAWHDEPVPDADRDLILDALRSGTVAPQLLALLPTNPRLPVTGTPTVAVIKLDQWFQKGVEAYRIQLAHEVAAKLVYGELVGFVELQRTDGTPIESFNVPESLVPMMAAELNQGRVPEFIANLLEHRTFQVRPDTQSSGGGVPGSPVSRWFLTTTSTYSVVYDPGRLIVAGLAFTGAAAASGDLTVFPENRNPAAYTVLAEARYPWLLPFDVFTEEVRACLATVGTTRLDLIRVLRPSQRNASVLDACEILHTVPGQIRQLTGPDPAETSVFWGLAETGNHVSEPSGDTGAPPIPEDWVGALSRLSVLLQRSRVGPSTLFGALGSRFVSAGTAPVLQPPSEDKPSRIDVQGLTKPRLDRLHRFLRLRLITGWSLRDLDLSLDAVTRHFTTSLTDAAVQALAALHELAGRLDVPVRQAAAWLGALETGPFTDREAPGEPVLPSLYDEIFVRGRADRTTDSDFALDKDHAELAYITTQRAAGIDPPVLKTLTSTIPDLSRALHAKPSDVSALITAQPPLADDTLTVANLAALAGHSSFARALGLGIPEYLLLRSLTGEDVFPADADAEVDERARRLLRFSDVVEEIRASGFTFSQLAEAVGAPELDSEAQRQRSLDLLSDLTDMQAGLAAALTQSGAGDPDFELRTLLTAAGWPPGAVNKILAAGAGEIGLNSTPELAVTVTASTAPSIPAGLPFAVAPGATPGQFVILAQLDALATADAPARFADLAAVAGLGPLTDPTAPAARLKVAWDALQKQIHRLAIWLQSIDLPISRTSFTFTGTVPPGLGDSAARLRYDPAARELVLTGYLDQSERATSAALSDEPHFAEAVQALAERADTYEEQRAGSRLISEQAVRDLMLRTPAPQTRYAAVLQAAATPSRRRVLARLAADKFAIQLPLLTALDDAAQLSSPPVDVLAPLCSTDFATADLHHGPVAGPWLAAVAALRRVGMLTSALRVHSSELAWFDLSGGFTGLAQLGFGPAADMTPTQQFVAWRRATALYQQRASMPGQAATLEAIRVAAASGGAAGDVLEPLRPPRGPRPDDVLTIIERAYQLPAGSASALRLDGLITIPADLLDPLLLRRVDTAAKALGQVGATAEVTLSLCQATPSETEARAARGLFMGKYGPQVASDGLRAAMNVLRDRQRTALVDYLIQRDGLVDATDLHARYLLDVEMGPGMRTSRIKQAISSTQLFIQRWLMNLESREIPPPGPELAKAWEWTRSYRVWEANRKVFLFPENWLVPSLRDDKSHLFAALESTLLQSEVTSERAIQALRQYLDGLDEMSKITVMAMYRESTGPKTETVHVVGRTAHQPVKYYYRQWHRLQVAGIGTWDPWEPLEVVGDTHHIVVFTRNGRPHIAWLDITDAQTPRASAENNGQTPASSTPNWALQLVWSRRDQSGWTAPKRSPNKITHQKPINKDDTQTTFALRVEPANPSGPQIRCYGASDTKGVPEPDPVPWKDITGKDVTVFSPLQKGTLLTESVLVQVLGETSKKRYVPLNDAVVGLWATMKPIIGAGEHFIGWGTPEDPILLSTTYDGIYETFKSFPGNWTAFHKMTIYVQVRYADKTATTANPISCEVDLDLDRCRNEVRFGFVFPGVSTPQTQRNRRLGLFSIGTGNWGLASGLRWTQGDVATGIELPVQGITGHEAEHYCSGYRFGVQDPVSVFGTALIDQPVLEPVFVSAAASDAATGLGLPVYIEAESSAAAGFIARQPDGPMTYLPAVELTHFTLQRALDAASDTIALPAGPPDPASVASAGHITPASGIHVPFHAGDPQFDRALPYAGYDWEVFFHIPMMVAQDLVSHQRYGEALRWLHTIFDPTATDSSGQPQWWRFAPFAAAGQGVGIDILLKVFSSDLPFDPDQRAAFQAQLEFSRTSPFHPDGIARMRIRAYQWMVVLKYLDVLIAWGDQQFRRDTIESINEATQLYLLAGELLGRRPTQLPERPPLSGPPTFASLVDHLDDFSNAWLSLADMQLVKVLGAWLAYLIQLGYGPGDARYDDAIKQLSSLLAMPQAFCVPRNDQLDEYWDLVEDRLFKVRNNQNIDGVQRRLALFEPPIDPALLIRAVAAGLDISSVLSEVFAPPTPYRFSLALQQAEEFCAEVKALGATLLSVLEKRDAEDVARLRSTQELEILKLVGDFRCRQLDEAQANLTALRQSRETAETRYRHYQRLLGKEPIQTPQPNDRVQLETPRLQLGGSTSDRVDADLRGFGLTLEEADQLGWLTVGNTYSLISGAIQTVSGVLHSVPNASVNWGAWSVSFGGSNMGSAAGAVGQFFNMLASNASFQASRSAIIAGHQRRYDDWVLQSNLAGKEIEAIDKQVLAAQIRVDLATKEISQHDKQVQNAKSVDEFLREKFTATELYQWMTDRVTEVHTGAYQLAYDLARRAQRAFSFELGAGDPGIISFGSWDGQHRGLLAGERLSLDLKRLKSAYAERNRRELEVTKHVSLATIDPLALLTLQATGSCEFVTPELAYDLDFPGHYFRRIKTVAVSLPCVVGPYTSVAGTLTLLENSLRASPIVPKGTDQPDYRRDVVPIQSVAISTGSGDSGMFELNFRDERYLPFEGAGAISRWRFELPSEFRSFDYGSISDLVLHVRYTARDGGEPLKKDAKDRVQAALKAQDAQMADAGQDGMLVRAVSLPHEFPTEWARLHGSTPTPQTMQIGTDRFPFLTRDRAITIWKVGLYVRGPSVTPEAEPPLTITAPAAAHPGDHTPTPIPWGTPTTRADSAALYEFTLEQEPPLASSASESWPWAPITISNTAPMSWTVTTAQPDGGGVSDTVLAFWWRLAASSQPGRP